MTSDPTPDRHREARLRVEAAHPEPKFKDDSRGEAYLWRGILIGREQVFAALPDSGERADQDGAAAPPIGGDGGTSGGPLVDLERRPSSADSGERAGLREAAQAMSDWFGDGPQPGVVLDLRAALGRLATPTRDAQPAEDELQRRDELRLGHLNRLEALARAATPGPWKAGPGTKHYVRGGHFGAPQTVADCRYKNGEADAAYIAAISPDVVLALVEEVRATTPAPEARQSFDALVNSLAAPEEPREGLTPELAHFWSFLVESGVAADRVDINQRGALLRHFLDVEAHDDGCLLPAPVQRGAEERLRAALEREFRHGNVTLAAYQRLSGRSVDEERDSDES